MARHRAVFGIYRKEKDASKRGTCPTPASAAIIGPAAMKRLMPGKVNRAKLIVPDTHAADIASESETSAYFSKSNRPMIRSISAQ